MNWWYRRKYLEHFDLVRRSFSQCTSFIGLTANQLNTDDKKRVLKELENLSVIARGLYTLAEIDAKASISKWEIGKYKFELDRNKHLSWIAGPLMAEEIYRNYNGEGADELISIIKMTINPYKKFKKFVYETIGVTEQEYRYLMNKDRVIFDNFDI